MGANGYGGFLFWRQLVASVAETGLFSPSSAWAFLCTLLHTMCIINLAYAIATARGLHRLLARLNAIRLRHTGRQALLMFCLIAAAALLSLVALGLILALLLHTPTAPKTSTASTAHSATHSTAHSTAEAATPAARPTFVWVLFQVCSDQPRNA